MIIGTAGHVDHGKTTLVRALTGVDTDRLPEEKARGISIELGYAYLHLPDADTLGFVDVPGHERFVHTMLAGACGIDHALLVVAADDGVMPQTREHLGILSLLGVSGATVALTKVDRVDPQRQAEVAQEIRTLLAGTALAEAPLHAVDAIRGMGVDALRADLLRAARQRRRAGASGHFRLAIDRSFVLEGLGTVVAGTVFSGEVRVGDPVVLTPGDRAARVRSLHAQNRPAERAGVGERCALQLAGVARDQAPRGAWVVSPDAAASTTRFDALLHLLPDAPRPLRHWTPVHLHLGAAHLTARIALLEGESLPPGASARIQVVTDQPLRCWHDDAFVIRDQSARHTLGGGRVLDPFGWARHRGSPPRLSMLAALATGALPERLAALIRLAPLGIDTQQLALSLAVPLAPLLEHRPEIRQIRAGQRAFAFHEVHWSALQAQVLEHAARYHRETPEELGVELGRLRRMALPQLDRGVFDRLVAELQGDGRLARSGAWLHLPEHRVELAPAEQALAERLLPRLTEGRFDPPWVRDHARDLAVDETLVRATLRALARRGMVHQVVRDLFYSEVAIRQLAGIVAGLQTGPAGAMAAEFRDATNLGRKRAIQILEYFDRVGYTRRVRDGHRVRNDSVLAQELLAPQPSPP